MSNCGLKALEQMASLNNVSMFTLIHLARDNGLQLYFCKVEPDELVQVTRPAIFHQENHFVFCKNGSPMPEGQYDGYVLTPRPLHEPLPFSLAKKIRGQKNIGATLQPIVTGVASLINPLLGAAVGAGFGGARAAGLFGDDEKGEYWRIGTGAISGALGKSNPGLSALSAAAGEVPGAIKSGNYGAPIAAGLGQYGSNIAAGGFGQGFSQAGQQGAGFLGKLSGGVQGGIGALRSGAQKLAGGGASSNSGVSIASGAGIGSTPAGYKGGVTIPGVGSFSGGVGGLQTRALPGQEGGFNFKSILNAAGGGKKLAGLVGSTFLNQPDLESDSRDDYSKASQFLGGDNFNALPEATRSQLERYVNTPIDQLTQEFIQEDDRGVRLLEERKQKEIDAVGAQFANFGQDPKTSSDAQQRITEVSRQYDEAIAEHQQNVQNQAQTKAIQFKQDILEKSMSQGNFDTNTAMELASLIGRDKEMDYAIKTKDHEGLQDLLAEIFSIGQNPASIR